MEAEAETRFVAEVETDAAVDALARWRRGCRAHLLLGSRLIVHKYCLLSPQTNQLDPAPFEGWRRRLEGARRALLEQLAALEQRRSSGIGRRRR